MANRIGSLARRVRRDTYFLASALEDFANSERLGDAELAKSLGCQVDALDMLRLCRKPRLEHALFLEDIDRIASQFGIDAGILAQVVRRSNALAALRRGSSDERGLLMAARDRSDDQSARDGGEEDRP